MTSGVRQPRPANAVARQAPVVESFADFAWSELAAAPMHPPGVCYLPECSRPFIPRGSWARYSCADCERQARQELRRWGLRMAEPMLAWRIGKYETTDQAIVARTRKARQYLTRLQSEWLRDRQNRMERAMHGQG